MTEIVLNMTGCDDEDDADDKSNRTALLQSGLSHFVLCSSFRELTEQDTNGFTCLYIKFIGVKWLDYNLRMAANDFLEMAESGLKLL